MCIGKLSPQIYSEYKGGVSHPSAPDQNKEANPREIKGIYAELIYLPGKEHPELTF